MVTRSFIAALLLQILSGCEKASPPVLRLQPVNCNPDDEAKAFVWFDSLGFPDFTNSKYVRVATGSWTQTYDKPRQNTHLTGFLLKDDGDSFTVLTLGLETRMFRRTKPETPEHKRIACDVVDTESAVGQYLEAIGQDRDELRRFGETMAERVEIFVLARFCAGRGFARPAHELCGYAAAILDPKTRKPPGSAGLQHALAADIAHSMMWRGILAFGDRSIPRKGLLESFRSFIKNYPESEHAPRARETADLLQRMVEEDDAHERETRKPLEEMTTSERVAELIFQLRDQNGLQCFQPGSCDIFQDDRREKSPAHQLVRVGYDGVPQLIESIDDVRFTRCVGYHRDFYFSHHVLRVGDCALAILQGIAGRRFYKFTYTNAAMVKDGDAASTRQRLKSWWAEFKNKGEKQMLIEGAESGDVDQAQRLVERYPEAALAPIMRGLEHVSAPWRRAELVTVIAEVRDEAAVSRLLEELRHGPAMRSRVAAARGLRRRGRTDGLSAMIDEWRWLPAAAARRDDDFLDIEGVIRFLASSGKPEAIKSLADGLSRRPLDQRLVVISALGRSGHLSVFSTGSGTTLQPMDHDTEQETEALPAIEALLVEALADTEAREGMWGSWDGKDFRDPRICDIAGHILQTYWPKKYAFDLSAEVHVRDRRRWEMQNIWRKENGFPPLPTPK